MPPSAEEVTPCELRFNCRNAPEHFISPVGRCHECKWAVSGGGTMNKYRPINRRIKHPLVESEKLRQRLEARRKRRQAERAKDQSRRRILQKAKQAEKATERKIIAATKNSGRVRQDGDHSARGFFALDTKLQSRRLHPQVDLGELDKIRLQACRNGYPAGALVLRNRAGRGVVVLAEEDFAKVLAALPFQS